MSKLHGVFYGLNMHTHNQEQEINKNPPAILDPSSLKEQFVIISILWAMHKLQGKYKQGQYPIVLLRREF